MPTIPYVKTLRKKMRSMEKNYRAYSCTCETSKEAIQKKFSSFKESTKALKVLLINIQKNENKLIPKLLTMDSSGRYSRVTS